MPIRNGSEYIESLRNRNLQVYLFGEKRLGILDIADKIGMPQIKEEEVWAVAVNRFRKGKDKWRLISVIKEGKNEFIDTDEESRIMVATSNYKVIDSEWWSFSVSENVNKSIEITKELN